MSSILLFIVFITSSKPLRSISGIPGTVSTLLPSSPSMSLALYGCTDDTPVNGNRTLSTYGIKSVSIYFFILMDSDAPPSTALLSFSTYFNKSYKLPSFSTPFSNFCPLVLYISTKDVFKFFAIPSGIPISCCLNTGNPVFSYLDIFSECSLDISVNWFLARSPISLKPSNSASIAVSVSINVLRSSVLSTTALTAFAITAGTFLVNMVFSTAPDLPIRPLPSSS